MADAPAAAPAVPVAPPKGAPAAPPAAAAAANPEATETIKVNGKEIKVTKAQLIAYAQKGMFADGKLKSMGTLTEKTSALLNALKTPEGLLGILKDKSLGANPKEVLRSLLKSDLVDDELKEDIARWTYENVVQPGQLTPEQVEQKKKLTDYERLKKEDADRKAAALSEQNKAQMNQIYTAVRSEVTKQITEDKTFPKTEGAIKAVIDTLKAINKKGFPVNSENVAKALAKVKKDHLIHQQTMFDAIEDPEQLIALFGEARALKISQALIKRLKNKAAAKAPAAKDEEALTGDKARQKKFGVDRHGYHVMDV